MPNVQLYKLDLPPYETVSENHNFVIKSAKFLKQRVQKAVPVTSKPEIATKIRLNLRQKKVFNISINFAQTSQYLK